MRRISRTSTGTTLLCSGVPKGEGIHHQPQQQARRSHASSTPLYPTSSYHLHRRKRFVEQPSLERGRRHDRRDAPQDAAQQRPHQEEEGGSLLSQTATTTSSSSSSPSYGHPKKEKAVVAAARRIAFPSPWSPGVRSISQSPPPLREEDVPDADDDVMPVLKVQMWPGEWNASARRHRHGGGVGGSDLPLSTMEVNSSYPHDHHHHPNHIVENVTLLPGEFRCSSSCSSTTSQQQLGDANEPQQRQCMVVLPTTGGRRVVADHEMEKRNHRNQNHHGPQEAERSNARETLVAVFFTGPHCVEDSLYVHAAQRSKKHHSHERTLAAASPSSSLGEAQLSYPFLLFGTKDSSSAFDRTSSNCDPSVRAAAAAGLREQFDSQLLQYQKQQGWTLPHRWTCRSCGASDADPTRTVCHKCRAVRSMEQPTKKNVPPVVVGSMNNNNNDDENDFSSLLMDRLLRRWNEEGTSDALSTSPSPHGGAAQSPSSSSSFSAASQWKGPWRCRVCQEVNHDCSPLVAAAVAPCRCCGTPRPRGYLLAKYAERGLPHWRHPASQHAAALLPTTHRAAEGSSSDIPGSSEAVDPSAAAALPTDATSAAAADNIALARSDQDDQQMLLPIPANHVPMVLYQVGDTLHNKDGLHTWRCPQCGRANSLMFVRCGQCRFHRTRDHHVVCTRCRQDCGHTLHDVVSRQACRSCGDTLLSARSVVTRRWSCYCSMTNIGPSCVRCRLPRIFPTPSIRRRVVAQWDFRTCSSWACTSCYHVNAASRRVVTSVKPKVHELIAEWHKKPGFRVGGIFDVMEKDLYETKVDPGSVACERCRAPWHARPVDGGRFWQCSCHMVNPMTRKTCADCSKPNDASLLPPMTLTYWLPSDWVCVQCTQHNYSTRGSCVKCGVPKHKGMFA